MTIDQKAVDQITGHLFNRLGLTKLGLRLEDVEGVAREVVSLAALPAPDQPFPSHRFDGAKEVPSYTSNSSAPASDHAYEAKYNGEGYSFTGNSTASDHAGLVERLERWQSETVNQWSDEYEPREDWEADVSNAMMEWAKASDEAATALSAGVKVKPLEWASDGQAYQAIPLHHICYYIAPFTSGVWKLTLSFGGMGVLAQEFNEVLAAKAAAQADYERRIRSALSDAPVVTEASE